MIFWLVLRLEISLQSYNNILKDFWFLLETFFEDKIPGRKIFTIKILWVFHNSSFALRYFFHVNGKATVRHTPCSNKVWQVVGQLELQLSSHRQPTCKWYRGARHQVWIGILREAYMKAKVALFFSFFFGPRETKSVEDPTKMAGQSRGCRNAPIVFMEIFVKWVKKNILKVRESYYFIFFVGFKFPNFKKMKIKKSLDFILSSNGSQKYRRMIFF